MTATQPITDLMRIGQLSKQAGKTTRALRLYEQLGLLNPVKRSESGYRLYDQSALLRIQWIDRLTEFGFSLAESHQFLKDLEAHEYGPSQMHLLREFYRLRLSETKSHIERLQSLSHELEASLDYLSTCQSCAPKTHRSHCQTCSEHEEQAPVPRLISAIHSTGI